MKAKITIEWENGITFVAENAEIKPHALELLNQPMFDEVTELGMGVVHKIEYVDMSLTARLFPNSDDELYRHTDTTEKKP